MKRATAAAIFMCSSRGSTYLTVMAYVGIGLLIVAALLFGAGLAGVWPMFEISYFNQTGLRGVAGIAVAGCLLAAIAYWEN